MKETLEVLNMPMRFSLNEYRVEMFLDITWTFESVNIKKLKTTLKDLDITKLAN